MLQRAPATLYARLAICAANPALGPPLRPGTPLRAVRWAWLIDGAAQALAGQAAHARAAVARRLREGPPPAFPPGLRDASLLGGTLLDLLRIQRGERAVAELALRLHPHGPHAALSAAFHTPVAEVEARWRDALAATARTARRRARRGAISSER
jgi:hypothetical protein